MTGSSRSRPGGGWLRGLIGIWLGRRASTSPPIASLLARARTQPTLPEVNPGRTLINRLWPLLFSTIGAGALAFVLPQVPAVADRVRDHLDAGLAAPGVGGDGDRGARRRALLRPAHRRRSSRSASSARLASAPTCSSSTAPAAPAAPSRAHDRLHPEPVLERHPPRAAVLPRLRDRVRVRRAGRDLRLAVDAGGGSAASRISSTRWPPGGSRPGSSGGGSTSW